MRADIKFGILIISCLLWEANAVNCTGTGRFTDTNDVTCKNYTLCVSVAVNIYQGFNYTCPASSVFDPTESRCSTNYKCNNFVCTQEGLFPDPANTNCTGFVECIAIDTTFITTRYVCPGNTFFNPNTSDCMYNYNCSVNSYNTQSPNATAEFTCTESGRFPNTSDSLCKSYHFCVRFNNGAYAKYDYTCPGSSVFSPVSKVCTTEITCSKT